MTRRPPRGGPRLHHPLWTIPESRESLGMFPSEFNHYVRPRLTLVWLDGWPMVRRRELERWLRRSSHLRTAW